MKRFTLLTLCLGIMLSLTASVTNAQAPAGGDNKKRSVGLIDMAKLFKDYKKFGDMREQLRSDIKSSDDKAKQMAAQLQNLQKMMKDGTYKEGTPDYNEKENQLIQQSTQFEAFRKSQQREFLRRESKIYKEVYSEVVEAVGQYAEYYNYDVILRYNGADIDETDNPQKLIQNMNRQVIWNSKGVDITDAVLKYLNQRYSPETAAKPGDTTTK